jgi:hypothetical protein
VPSEKNEKISRLPDPVLIVGGVADGQTTVVQVTVRELVSCVKIKMKLLPATAVGIVMVALPPEIVNRWNVPFAKSIVTDVPAVFT